MALGTPRRRFPFPFLFVAFWTFTSYNLVSPIKLKLSPMGGSVGHGGVCSCKKAPPHPIQGHIPVPKLMRKKGQICSPHSGNCSSSWGWLSLKGKRAESHTLGCVHLNMKGLIPSPGYSWLQQTHSQAKQKSSETHPSPTGNREPWQALKRLEELLLMSSELRASSEGEGFGPRALSNLPTRTHLLRSQDTKQTGSL